MEIKLIFNEIADQIPDIAKLSEPQRLRSGWLNGVKELQVSYRGLDVRSAACAPTAGPDRRPRPTRRRSPESSTRRARPSTRGRRLFHRRRRPHARRHPADRVPVLPQHRRAARRGGRARRQRVPGPVGRTPAGITDPADAVAEAVATALEWLPEDKHLGLLLVPGRPNPHTESVTSDVALDFAHSMVRRFDVDWAGLGFTDADLDELAEHLLRIIQSFVIDPGRPPRQGDELRAYLRRWVGSAVTPPSAAANSSARTRRSHRH